MLTESFAQIACVLTVAVLFAAGLFALASWWRALVVAAPLLVTIPYGARSFNGEPMAVTALLASAALLASLVAARRFGPKKGLIVIALAAAAAVFFAGRRGCWSAPLWYASVHGQPFNLTELSYGAWCYPAVAFAAVPLLAAHRRAWWFPATAGWAAGACLLTMVFSSAAYIQYSFPLSSALVAALGFGALQAPRQADAAGAGDVPKETHTGGQ